MDPLQKIRTLRTLELMELVLRPTTDAYIKVAAERIILSRLATISAGERITLAKRASKRVAAALLLDPDHRVMQAALLNSHMTVDSIVIAVQDEKACEFLIRVVCGDPRWVAQPEVQAALLRNPRTPLEHTSRFIMELPARILSEILKFLRPELQETATIELQRRKAMKPAE